jgi:hypothetical protein
MTLLNARALVRLLLLSSFWLLVAPAHAVDTEGLDITVEVLDKNQPVDERLVNRIAIPGIPLSTGSAQDAPAASAPAADTLTAPLDRPLGAVKDLTRDALNLLQPQAPPAGK